MRCLIPYSLNDINKNEKHYSGIPDTLESHLWLEFKLPSNLLNTEKFCDFSCHPQYFDSSLILKSEWFKRLLKLNSVISISPKSVYFFVALSFNASLFKTRLSFQKRFNFVSDLPTFQYFVPWNEKDYHWGAINATAVSVIEISWSQLAAKESPGMKKAHTVSVMCFWSVKRMIKYVKLFPIIRKKIVPKALLDVCDTDFGFCNSR